MQAPLRITARIVATLTAISFTLAPVAFADRKRGYHDRGYERHEYRHHHGRRGDGYRHRSRHVVHNHYHYSPPRYRHAPPRRTVVVRHPPPRIYYPPPRTTVVTYGYAYGPHYYSGYSPRYRVGHHYAYAPSRTVYISDYHRHGLYAPPHGYHWVRDRDRGDAILASVATGAIIGLVVGALITD